MNETRNNKGYGIELSEFRSHFTIHCPSCDSKIMLVNKVSSFYITTKIACSQCGFNKKIGENSSYAIVTKDGKNIESKTVIENPKGIILVLWYSANFKGNSFWAYNEAHLKFLYEFINAKLRERSQIELKNRSIGSRLPKWITLSKNRKAITKLIESMI